MTRKDSIEKGEKAKKLAKALAGLKDGTYKRVREAARATGAPRSTLQDRLKGVPTKVQCNHSRQTLSPDEECALVKWAKQLSCTGNPVHHPFLRELAKEIAKPRVIDGDNRVPLKLGKHWVGRFLERNPSLHSRLAKNMETARKEVTEEEISNWFEEFARVVSEYGILQENIYNMDETGFLNFLQLDQQ
jgi:hypothetical protein